MNILLNTFRQLKAILELFKVKLTATITFCCIAGYLLVKPVFSFELLLVSLGTFLVASFSCGLNQLQESDIDKLMEHKHARPIPSGKLSKKSAKKVLVTSFITGLIMLLAGGNLITVGLALFAVILYNVVYTKLKKTSAYAAIYGGIIGGIPPIIGSSAADCSCCSTSDGWDISVILLSLLVIFWQVPHFWLITLIHQNDYKNTGHPLITDVFNPLQLDRIIFSWIFLSAICSITLAFNISAFPNIAIILITIISILIIILSFFLPFAYNSKNYLTFVFICLNIYIILILTVIVVFSYLQYPFIAN